MISYFGLTQQTAAWMIAKPAILGAVYKVVMEMSVLRQPTALTSCEEIIGPIHLSATSNPPLTAIWNADYLSGTGDEAWGFVAIDSERGLREELKYGQEVFERFIYVINQRLQGYLIDGALIHRTWANGAQTCLAGRGSEARHVNIGYFERVLSPEGGGLRTVVCVGPRFDFTDLSEAAEIEGRNLEILFKTSKGLIDSNRQRRVAHIDELSELRQTIDAYVRPEVEGTNEFAHVQFMAERPESQSIQIESRSYGLTYMDWVASGSLLTDGQRRILFSDAIKQHPLRIVGPGGSGKTLLMQLLVLRRLELAKVASENIRILYVVHNSAMASLVKNRFAVLDSSSGLINTSSRIVEIYTLADYGRQQLNLDHHALIDADGYQSKLFQLDQIAIALEDCLDKMPQLVAESSLLTEVQSSQDLRLVFATLIMTEISNAIKGHGLDGDIRRYVESERPVSRLHGVLSQGERDFVFKVFQKYHDTVFGDYKVLDTDDIALSVLGRLRTPIWELKRSTEGFDFVFVDETQLFNENERRLFSLFSNRKFKHVPVILALDEAQNLYGQASAGIATLGIPDVASENLTSIHRSTRSIIRLAFFVIQRSTDLFGSDFPDFTSLVNQMENDDHPLAKKPYVARPFGLQLGALVLNEVHKLRTGNLRQVAVICYAEQYWETLVYAFSQSAMPFQLLLKRGDRIAPEHPVVALTRPSYVGGQEFDAVILVGLEQGLVPPRVANNDALASAVEQQSIREIYLGVTRARYRVVVVLSPGATLNALMTDAIGGDVLAAVN